MPRSRRTCVRKLRIMKPAPASSTTVSASSATISAPVQRRARTPADADAAAFLQHLVDVGLRDVERGRQAEDDAGAEADRARRSRTRVPSIVNWIQYGRPTSCVARSNRRMPIAAMPSPTSAADQREHARSRSAAAGSRASAWRRARCAPRSRARDWSSARQQQVGDVGAGDQQHERDGAHQRQEHGADRPAVLALVEGLDAAPACPCWCRDCPRRACCEMLISSLCACSRVTPGARRPNTCELARVALLLLEIRGSATAAARDRC